MKKFAIVFVVSMFLTSVAYAVETPVADSAMMEATEEVTAKSYFCPMDGFTSDKPGKCEKCGMDLIEAPAGLAEATDAAAMPATE